MAKQQPMITQSNNPYWWNDDANPATQGNHDNMAKPEIIVEEVEQWDDFTVQFYYLRDGDKCRLMQRFDTFINFVYGVEYAIETEIKSNTADSMTVMVTEQGPGEDIHTTVHIIPFTKFIDLWK